MCFKFTPEHITILTRDNIVAQILLGTNMIYFGDNLLLLDPGFITK